MGNQMQAEFLAAGENAGELFRRIAAFGRIQPDAANLVAVRQRLFQGRECLFLG